MECTMLNNQSNLLKTRIYLIDNFDSFTYNLVNQLRPLVDDLKIFRNDVNFDSLTQIIAEDNENKIIVISPGPGCPDTAGITLKMIDSYKGKLPILGICLGHQAIVQAFSGIVGPAKEIIHGKGCDIELMQGQSEIFGQLKSPFRAARYHSLAATKIPPSLDVIASIQSEVMAIKHKEHKILGYQFHPESILTPRGGELLNNSLQWLAS